MDRTTLILHSQFPIGEVSPLIFGGFLEHLGRSIYTGVYDPASAHADADGTRRDVIDALRELEMTIVRYPGGNFASGYHWRDGVGAKDTRPTVRELAWQSIEPNTFGTDEFVKLCRKLDWQPMLAVNLGTGTPEEARDWVDYCNPPTLLEERNNLEDALVVAMFLMSFIRHADCVKIANLAQLVNVIGPVMTRGDELMKQTVFHAYA